MSTDPHAPTSAGPDPDDAALVAEDTVAVPVDAAPPEGDWLADPAPVAPSEPVPAPDPVVVTPSAFTPPGTPEPDGDGPLAQATAVAERPEVQVGLAFLGGAVLTLVLRRFGR